MGAHQYHGLQCHKPRQLGSGRAAWLGPPLPPLQPAADTGPHCPVPDSHACVAHTHAAKRHTGHTGPAVTAAVRAAPGMHAVQLVQPHRRGSSVRWRLPEMFEDTDCKAAAGRGGTGGGAGPAGAWGGLQLQEHAAVGAARGDGILNLDTVS